MAFPWKKVKNTRISQLVNDHLHVSQKRRDGSSLVVETGFPASLIDLFFKNRGKLKKPSKKKRRNPAPISPSGEVRSPAVVGSLISNPFPPPPPPPSSPALVGSPMSLRRSSFLAPPPPPPCVEEICVAGSSGSDGSGGAEEEPRGGGSGVNANRVFVGVLKMFVVVFLALATKRLTVGITISAAVLLLLEYVEKHHRLLSTPCAAAISFLRSFSRLFSYYKPEQKRQQSMNHAPTSRFHDHGIESLESTESISRNRVGYQEIELLEMAMKREESMRSASDSHKKSRKARIKSKMQKIVPKKFRSSRKDAEHIDQSDNGEESESGSISSSSLSDRSYREEDSKSSISSYSRLSDANEEADTKIEDKGAAAETSLAWRCMMLCLIALVGLIGGRPFALVLTLTWFLLLKLGQKLLPRSMKPPMINS